MVERVERVERVETVERVERVEVLLDGPGLSVRSLDDFFSGGTFFVGLVDGSDPVADRSVILLERIGPSKSLLYR